MDDETDYLDTLPSPYPPLQEWIERHFKRNMHKGDVDVLLNELMTLQVYIYEQKKFRSGPLKQQENLKKLRRIRDAMHVIERDLPSLILAADGQLRGFEHGGKEEFNKRVPEFFASLGKMRDALGSEKMLLAWVSNLRKGGGFFGPIRGRLREPWVGEAHLLFALFRMSFAKAGYATPNPNAVSERTPIVQVIRDALHWMGHGKHDAAQIAQSLKRSARNSKEDKRRSTEDVFHAAAAQRVVAGQKASDICPDDCV